MRHNGHVDFKIHSFNCHFKFSNIFWKHDRYKMQEMQEVMNQLTISLIFTQLSSINKQICSYNQHCSSNIQVVAQYNLSPSPLRSTTQIMTVIAISTISISCCCCSAHKDDNERAQVVRSKIIVIDCRLFSCRRKILLIICHES